MVYLGICILNSKIAAWQQSRSDKVIEMLGSDLCKKLKDKGFCRGKAAHWRGKDSGTQAQVEASFFEFYSR